MNKQYFHKAQPVCMDFLTPATNLATLKNLNVNNVNRVNKLRLPKRESSSSTSESLSVSPTSSSDVPSRIGWRRHIEEMNTKYVHGPYSSSQQSTQVQDSHCIALSLFRAQKYHTNVFIVVHLTTLIIVTQT